MLILNYLIYLLAKFNRKEGFLMENDFIVKTDHKIEQVDTVFKSILELTDCGLFDYLAIIEFHQRTNKVFFEEENFKKYKSEVDEALNTFNKIKEGSRKESDFVDLKRVVSKAMEKYSSLKGKPIAMEVAIKLRHNSNVRQISE